jgi:hypothetical protein
VGRHLIGVFLRQWPWLLAAVVLGLAGATALATLTPKRFTASAHVRVAALGPAEPILEPMTLAVEASDPSFVARVKALAHVEGALEFTAVYHTQLLAVRAVALSPEAATALLDAACALLVAEQNALLASTQAEAESRMQALHERGLGSVAFASVLGRKAVRIGEQSPVRPAGPHVKALLAAGLGLGVLLGLAVAYLRESLRRPSSAVTAS